MNSTVIYAGNVVVTERASLSGFDTGDQVNGGDPPLRIAVGAGVQAAADGAPLAVAATNPAPWVHQ